MPSPERVSHLVEYALVLARANSAPAISWLRVSGLMADVGGLAPYCHYRIKAMKIHLLVFYSPISQPLSRMVPMTDIFRM